MDADLGRRLVRRWRSGTDAVPVPAGPAPISAVQRGAIAFERLQPGTAVFNLAFAARHTGPLDEARFDAALTTLTDRHPSLRGRFDVGDGEPARTIAPPEPVKTQWTDLRHLPAQDRAAAAREYADRVAAEPFDLAAALFRVYGYRIADDERLLVFVAHHLVCDGISMQVLLAELEAAYRGELTGTMPDAVPAPLDPVALEYWREHLAGVPELDLPADRARPAQPGFHAGSVPLALPDDLVAAAEDLGRSEQATFFMVVLAAYQLLLREHSGQTDFVVGSPEAGRSHAGQHRLVGLLADLLLLRADLSGRPTFRDLVRRAKATCLAAFAHRGVPLADLIDALGSGRQVDATLVQATLVLHGERAAATLAGAPLTPVPVTRPGLRHAVEVHLWRERGQLRGTWDYSTERFEPGTAARMAAQFVGLLRRALAEPDRPVDQLDLLTDEDRTLLDRWGRGPVPEDPETTLTALFAERVAETPDAVAITDRRRALTYRELDERSNRLAHLLRDRGVGAGDTVGVLLPRTVDLAVATLGILKIGAAYLPLDPAYPAERTEYMRQDSGVRMVVTVEEVAALDQWPAHPVDSAATPDSLAYVLYTSGSTGRPKGVLLTHRSSVTMVLWGRRKFTRGELSRVLASTSICFDVSVFELFGTLCAGGTIVVVDTALSLLTEQPDVTFICSAPTAVRTLIAAGAIPPSVRVVGLGGEAVTGTIVDDLYATGHVEAVINLYGPTEDTTYSTWATLLPGEQPPPIGALLPHERGYVLDRALRRVPPGGIGELYLAGRGLSLGYVNKAALTASRYVADPYAPVPGERMYRTGDLVRYRTDGALLYLGRQDFQVKVRGQRIELGEIETTLQRHPDVLEAVVGLHNDRLVGYVTPQNVDLDDLRAYLRRTLPVVMVPNTLIPLEALPQTPNGKVDRLALPAPEAPTGTGGDALRGPDEELVAGIWRRVLDLETVARDDDFFDLGGDSLLAGQVLTRLRDLTGNRLPLRLVFEHSRLADLAAALPPSGTADAASEQSAVTPRAADAEPVLSFDQERLWLESVRGRNVAYNIHGRQWLRGPLDVAVLERSIRAIIARHETLRTSFPFVDGGPVPRVSDPDPGWRLPVRDAGTATDAEALADAQAEQSFDLAAGPLFGCLLVRLNDSEHLLSMTIHHIVSDGWSVGLVLRELSALYQAGGDPARADLPPLPVQYRDYAVWQRDTLAGDRLARQVERWRERLSGAPQALSLPVTRRRSPAQDAAGGRVRAVISASDAAALRPLCREHDVTPFMAVFAALAAVLHRWSAQDDLVIGVPVNTRGAAPGTESLVGFFVNSVPVRVDLGGDPLFAELLARVRRAALDSYVDHGETPFHVLVRELRVVRDPCRTPVFQVMLNMIENADRQWQLPGVETRTPAHPPQPGKVDLSLDVLHDDGELTFDLSYHADLYDAETMRALLDQVRSVLLAGAVDPARGILQYELPVARPDDGRVDWGFTAADRIAVLSADPASVEAARRAAADVGATTVVAEHTGSAAWLRGTSATAVYLTPPVLRAMAEPFPPTVRQVFVHHRGDLLSHDVSLLRRLAPAARVVALYRLSEAGQPAGVHVVPGTWSARTAPLRVPIGVLGGTAELLNPAGRATAIGEVGEIHLDTVATGDRARRCPGGEVEYAAPPVDVLETVAALRDLPDVADAVVTTYPEHGRVAYVLAAGRPVDLGRLRQHLVTHLPEYLVPRHVIPVDQLPLTRAGEYDLTGLPQPEDARAVAATG